MKAVLVNRNGAIFIPSQSLMNYVMKNLLCLLALILASSTTKCGKYQPEPILEIHPGGQLGIC